MAAPTPTDTTMGILLDFPRSGRERKAESNLRGPDEILGEYENAKRGLREAFDRDFRAAVYRELSADLATWPAAFRRRLGGGSLRERLDWNPGHSERWNWQRFQDGRRLGVHEDSPEQSCRCGCRGFNGEFVDRLRWLRDTAREARQARAKALHAPRSKAVLARRRERIERHKSELLELLWLHGQRKIDRAQLRQHAAEHIRAELADTQRAIAEAPANTREYRARLRENRSYNRSGVTDRPLSPQRRREFERAIAETQANVPKWRARVAELEALLADPHALAREWTGCERAAAGARA